MPCPRRQPEPWPFTGRGSHQGHQGDCPSPKRIPAKLEPFDADQRVHGHEYSSFVSILKLCLHSSTFFRREISSLTRPRLGVVKNPDAHFAFDRWIVQPAMRGILILCPISEGEDSFLSRPSRPDMIE